MGYNQGKNNSNYKHGLTKHPLHKAFRNAHQRCTNPNCVQYKQYKGRWGKNTVAELTLYYLKEYERFVKKYPHLKPSIDRIDEDGKYEIGNIQIIDRVENIKKYIGIKGGSAKGKLGKDSFAGKAVEGLIDGKWQRFETGLEAARETGIANSNISTVCRGDRDKDGYLHKTAGKDSAGTPIQWRFTK